MVDVKITQEVLESIGNFKNSGPVKGAANSSNKKPNEYYQLSSDKKIASGQKVGIERAKDLYGMSPSDVGKETQDIVRRRREALDGKDPASDALRRGKNQQIRAARASGANAGQLAQIERQAMQDIGQQEFMSQERALDAYQSLMGNILGGTTNLEMGFAGLEKSGETPEPVRQSSGPTVICTELHRQGYMPYQTLTLDRDYGKRIRANDPAVYIGYIYMANPIVKLMKKSDMVTSIISIPAMAWANNMAYNNSFAGKIINKIGTPICRTVGKVLLSLYKKGWIYA